MMLVAVPIIPKAVIYMLNPPHGHVRGVTCLRVLNQCSKELGGCKECYLLSECRGYFDYLVETDQITWKGAVWNVARYYQ